MISDVLRSECPGYIDHDWDCEGVIGKQMGECDLIYDIVSFVCLNCHLQFTELRPAGENLRGSDLS